jgi:CubicO group peptidase (beta-lactamase class C family)
MPKIKRSPTPTPAPGGHALVAVLALAALAASPATPAAYDWTALDAYLNSQTLVPGGGLVIRHRGVVVYAEKKFGNWTASQLQTPISVASVSKSYVAAIALMADEDPNVPAFSIDDLVSEHIPQAPALNPAYASMTVRQLLSMTAGLQTLTGFNSCLGRDASTFEGCTLNIISKPLWTNPATGMPVSPGEKFVYSGAPWNVRALAVTNAVTAAYSQSATWNDHPRGYLLDVCGWSNTYYLQSQNWWVGGGIATNLAEGGKMAEFLRTGWCNGAPRLSLDALQLMRANQWAGATRGSSPYPTYADGERTYGFGLFRNDAGPLASSPNLYLGPGTWGSHLFYETGRRYTGFLFMNDAFGDGSAVLEAIIPLIQAEIDLKP